MMHRPTGTPPPGSAAPVRQAGAVHET
jgi:hypothetical protein